MVLLSSLQCGGETQLVPVPNECSELPPASSNHVLSPRPILYRQRWVQLAYLSVLAFLSDWVCFSVAAAPSEWRSVYMHSQASLIDLFLFTNVIFCFVEPTIVARTGLRKAVVGSAILMALGCFLRSGIAPSDFLPFSDEMPHYTLELVGTIFVGAAQPFFQCTPPLLSATWFSPDERVLATSVAINANQIGIATAFIVGGWMAQDLEGMNGYFSLISGISLTTAIGAWYQFQDTPPTPPSCSAAARSVVNDISFPVMAWRLLSTRGFLQPLCGFMASIGITNAISSFISISLRRARFSTPSIFLAGAAFQFTIMFGSIFIGMYVDKTKQYKTSIMVMLIVTLVLLFPLGFAQILDKSFVMAALFLLGSCVGPVQPICVELAVDVVYPVDESTVVAVQQVSGNLFSALTVPLLEVSEHWHKPEEDFTPDYMILVFIALGATLFFATFNAPLKRLAMDTIVNSGGGNNGSGVETGCA